MRAAAANRGVQAALVSAVLFGAGTPLAKLLPACCTAVQASGSFWYG